MFQVGEVAQLRRYRPAQLVIAQAQPSNTPVGVSANAVPLSQRPVTQPVSVVRRPDAGPIPVFVGRFLPRSVTVSAPAGDGFPSSLASGLK